MNGNIKNVEELLKAHRKRDEYFLESRLSKGLRSKESLENILNYILFHIGENNKEIQWLQKKYGERLNKLEN